MKTTSQQASIYVGRFAPSPTGPLHLGSLVSALASFLDARARHGKWLVRIDDIDPLREQPGATRTILQALEAHQLHWDGDIFYQSQRTDAYKAIIRSLHDSHQAYHCACSRLQLKAHSLYPGTCRIHPPAPLQQTAVRVAAQAITISFTDQIQGLQAHNMASDIGDFVIQRKDGLVAYQLAAAVDDHYQGITHVVRGSDLLDSTTRQLYLHHLLKLPSPAYCHIPVLVADNGQKLSKQNHAEPLNLNHCAENLYFALNALNQQPPLQLKSYSSEQILQWAIEHWAPQQILKTKQLTLASLARQAFSRR